MMINHEGVFGIVIFGVAQRIYIWETGLAGGVVGACRSHTQA